MLPMSSVHTVTHVSGRTQHLSNVDAAAVARSHGEHVRPSTRPPKPSRFRVAPWRSDSRRYRASSAESLAGAPADWRSPRHTLRLLRGTPHGPRARPLILRCLFGAVEPPLVLGVW